MNAQKLQQRTLRTIINHCGLLAAALPAMIIIGASSFGTGPFENPTGGALAEDRPRVIVSTDIGGGDPDDFQSMVHYLVYADLFDTEGLISSPPKAGRKKDILDVIAAYEHDYVNLRSYSSPFPHPDGLRAITKQGATEPAPPEGYSDPTEGSKWIIRRANSSDARPLYTLVWGSITDVAQAVHDQPSIKSKIRVYSIGSWNTRQDPHARNYLHENHRDLWWIESDTAFRGMYVGGDQGGDLENLEFVRRHVKGHGALGDFFWGRKMDIKMGDTPSVLYLLRGDPNDPTKDHWGGRFVADRHGAHYWRDDPDPADAEKQFAGAKTVSMWREKYLRDWQARMGWCKEPKDVAGGAETRGKAPGAAAEDAGERPRFRIKCLTSGPKHHFFGYYGITPWNKSGKYLVCLESDFQDHLPSAEEPAAVGLVDARTGEFRKVGETQAWNFQQGAMLHWNPLDPENEIIFNDRKDGDLVSVILNVRTGEKRYLPRPVSAVSHNGKYALSLTYGRLRRLRPVVGYVGAKDPNPDSPHPDNDGVFLMDLRTGESKLVVSLDEVYRRLVKKYAEVEGPHLWFNHTVFNKNDTRFFFLARCWVDKLGRTRKQAMFSCNLDGSELREVVPFGWDVSHFDWRNPREILATARPHGPDRVHILFTDGLDDYKVIGEEFLGGDGHSSFAPDQKWIASDKTIGDMGEKILRVYNMETNEGMVLGRFPMKQYLRGDLRCDLHPRWNRTGDAICFDALETTNWTRQLHAAYLDFLEQDAIGSVRRQSDNETVRAEREAREANASQEGKLLVATCQFPVSADVAANAQWIRKQMGEASRQHADIVHFSECALSGYAGKDHETMEDFDWEKQRGELESILSLARKLRLWVVLGAAHRLSDGNKPHNSLYVISPDGEIVDRYDKRFCTKGDLKHYSPGDHFVTFDVNGVRCGCLICYDIRFPELYRQCHKLGVQLMFHSFYNARQKEDSIHPKIMPPSAQARAATNYIFLSVNNSSAPRSWESLFVTPDGLIQEKLVLDQPGVMINLVDTTKRYYDASRPYRLDCINGKWNSGEVVNDPRSRDRRSY